LGNGYLYRAWVMYVCLLFTSHRMYQWIFFLCVLNCCLRATCNHCATYVGEEAMHFLLVCFFTMCITSVYLFKCERIIYTPMSKISPCIFFLDVGAIYFFRTSGHFFFRSVLWRHFRLFLFTKLPIT